MSCAGAGTEYNRGGWTVLVFLSLFLTSSCPLPELPRHDGLHSQTESRDDPSLPGVVIVIRK